MLNLTRIPGLTSETIKAVAVSLQELRELYLYADAAIDNSAFNALADPTTCVVTKLTILDLCGC